MCGCGRRQSLRSRAREAQRRSVSSHSPTDPPLPFPIIQMLSRALSRSMLPRVVAANINIHKGAVSAMAARAWQKGERQIVRQPIIRRPFAILAGSAALLQSDACHRRVCHSLPHVFACSTHLNTHSLHARAAVWSVQQPSNRRRGRSRRPSTPRLSIPPRCARRRKVGDAHAAAPCLTFNDCNMHDLIAVVLAFRLVCRECRHCRDDVEAEIGQQRPRGGRSRRD